MTLTAPAEGASFTAPANINLSATAIDLDGINRVEFYQGTTLVATSINGTPDGSVPFTATWSNIPAGSYTVTAKAYDSLGASRTSTPVHVTVNSAGGTTGAVFLTTDTTTLGNWKGVYGSDGFNVINDTTNYPAYAIVTPAGNNSWTWADPTSDVRALQHASGSNRLAATWYGSTYTIDINITDGQTHRLALYIVDWEPFGRTQRFDVRDASTNALLDTRTASAFTGGQYLVWTVQGHVTIQVTQVGGGGGAVVSGVFFGQ